MTIDPRIGGTARKPSSASRAGQIHPAAAGSHGDGDLQVGDPRPLSQAPSQATLTQTAQLDAAAGMHRVTLAWELDSEVRGLLFLQIPAEAMVEGGRRVDREGLPQPSLGVIRHLGRCLEASRVQVDIA